MAEKRQETAIRTNVTPTQDALSNSDPVLHEMIRYIKHFLDRPEPDEVAQHAALIYLAAMSAFQARGLLQLEWVPALSIDIGLKEFEITLSTASVPPSQEGMDIDLPSSRNYTMRSASRAVRPQSASDDSSPRSKLSLLLGSLLKREPRLSGGSGEKHVDEADLKPAIQYLEPATGESSRLKTAERLAMQCMRLDSLGLEANRVSIAVNHCYWSIGQSYREFTAMVDLTASDHSHPRTQEKEVFKKLCAVPQMQGILQCSTARSRLRKRLQRARKFVILVDVFGRNILSAVPEVNVSRLDTLRLEDLKRLVTGSVERTMIARIKERLQ